MLLQENPAQPDPKNVSMRGLTPRKPVYPGAFSDPKTCEVSRELAHAMGDPLRFKRGTQIVETWNLTLNKMTLNKTLKKKVETDIAAHIRDTAELAQPPASKSSKGWVRSLLPPSSPMSPNWGKSTTKP